MIRLSGADSALSPTVGLICPVKKTQLCDLIQVEPSAPPSGTPHVPTSRRDTGSRARVNNQASAAPVSGTASSSPTSWSQGTTAVRAIPVAVTSNTAGIMPARLPSTVPSPAVIRACEPASALRSRGAAPTLARVMWSFRESAMDNPVVIPAALSVINAPKPTMDQRISDASRSAPRSTYGIPYWSL